MFILGLHVVSCYSSGLIRFWDLKQGQSVRSYPNAHDGEILCIDLSNDGNLIATAGLDLKIHLINTSNGKFIADLVCDRKTEDDDNSIESLAFCHTIPSLIACATLKGQLFIWDLNTQSIRSKCELVDGFSKVVWSNKNDMLYASTLAGELNQYDGRNLQLKKCNQGHSAEILDFCVNETFDYLFTASNDGSIKTFKINN